MNYKLPPLPPQSSKVFSTAVGPVKVLAYNGDDMQAYAIAAIEAHGVPDALREEAVNLASILSGMVEGGYSDLETLYTEDQADGDAFVKRAAEVLDLLASAPPASQAKQHPDDAAVDRFAAAMKDKLAIARQKGRGGWETCRAEDLGRMLREHVEKGDPRDVANFCMFLWSLGHGIASQVKQCEWTNCPTRVGDKCCNEQASMVQQEPVAYLDIGAVGYIDLGTEQPIEKLQSLPPGRHMLGIIGTFGANGYVSAPQAKPQPLTNDQKRDMWTAATIEQPSARGCYFRGVEDAEHAHGITKE